VIAPVSTPPIAAAPVFGGATAQPPPGENDGDGNNDPVKRKEELVKSGRARLEPVEKGDERD
jgi:hypothetical protein